jgi:hypothetical protein
VGVTETMTIARSALEGFAPAAGEVDARNVSEMRASRRSANGVVDVRSVGVEAEVRWPDRPTKESLELMRAALAGAGFRVLFKERRECSQPGCSSDAVTEWDRPDQVPSAWFSSITCGRHNFKQCVRCKSTYRLTSYSAAGQAPSVQCEVCGHVLIEWGGSKRWDVELITQGPWTR